MVPEYTATSQNDGGMKRNGQEGVPEYTGTSWNDTATKRKDTSATPEKAPEFSRLTQTGMTKERTLIQRCIFRVKEYEEQGDHWQARPENSNSLVFVRILLENKKY